MWRPPSTRMTSPVTYWASSRKTTACATSSGDPSRCSGVVERRCSAPSALHPSGRSTTPGATALTRTFGASARAIARVICTTAALVIPCGTYAGQLSNSTRSPMLTITPPESTSACAARCDRKYGARTLMANIVSQSDSVVSPTGVRSMIAAEFTSAASVPRHWTARSTSACADSSRVRSACSTRARPPASVIMRAVSSAPSLEPLKCTTTCMPRAPSASAMARPTLRPAPVTSATRPVSGSATSGGWGTSERLEPLILPPQPLDRHAHHADGARTVGGTVPVGATARDQTHLIDEGPKARDVLWRVARMLHLDAVEPERDERLHALPRAAGTGMREDRQATGVMDHRDRFAHAQLILGDVRGPARAQIPIERIAHVGRPAVGDERTRHVRTADGAGPRLQEHVIERDLHALRLQQLDDTRGTPATHLAKRAQPALEHCRIAEMQTEQMCLRLPFDGAQLDAVHDSNSELGADRPGFGETGYRVVISERDRGERSALGGAHDFGGRAGPVRRRRMHVQIDDRGDARRLRHAT